MCLIKYHAYRKGGNVAPHNLISELERGGCLLNRGCLSCSSGTDDAVMTKKICSCRESGSVSPERSLVTLLTELPWRHEIMTKGVKFSKYP